MEARKIETTDIDDKRIIVKSDLTGVEQVFTHMVGAVAWGDPKEIDPVLSDHALVVACLLDDGRIYVLSEFSGGYYELINEMLVQKDRMLVSLFYAPSMPGGLFETLFDIDGLTKYEVSHRNRYGQVVYKQKPEYWPTFRDYQTIAQIYSYDEDLETDLEACKLTVEQLTKHKKVLWRSKFLPRLEKIINQTTGDAVEKPLFRAYVAAVYHLDIIARGKQKRKDYAENNFKFPWGSGNVKG